MTIIEEKAQLKKLWQETSQDGYRNRPEYVVAQYGDCVVQKRTGNIGVQRRNLQQLMQSTIYKAITYAAEAWGNITAKDPQWYFFETEQLVLVGWILDFEKKREEK